MALPLGMGSSPHLPLPKSLTFGKDWASASASVPGGSLSHLCTEGITAPTEGFPSHVLIH